MHVASGPAAGQHRHQQRVCNLMCSAAPIGLGLPLLQVRLALMR